MRWKAMFYSKRREVSELISEFERLDNLWWQITIKSEWINNTDRLM